MPEKGMDLLIKAFRCAFTQGDEPTRLAIVGRGVQLEELRQFASSDRRIVLIDVQSEIAPFYRAFDLYVSAARFEPFGLTILEAMDVGCPLIITRVEGPQEFVDDPRVRWARRVRLISVLTPAIEEEHQARGRNNPRADRPTGDLATHRKAGGQVEPQLQHAETAIKEFYHKLLKCSLSKFPL